MSSPPLFPLIGMLCLLCLFNGCSEETRAQFAQLSEVQKALVAEYRHGEIHIRITNGRFLGINFINSPFNNLEDDEKQRTARQIAALAVATLRNKATAVKIEKVAVTFTLHERKFMIIDYTNSLNTFLFDAASL